MFDWIKNSFSKATPSLLPGEKELLELGIAYEKRADGTLRVSGNINLSNKKLNSLPDLSRVAVDGNFWCNDNQLTSLEGSPASVGGDFRCDGNHLTSLKGSPTSIGGSFGCSRNQLTSLIGHPHCVGGSFLCSFNKLTSLENAPQKFKKLHSDFGEFASWDAVPEELRISPETKERLRQEEREIEESIKNFATLQRPIKAPKPFKFKNKS